MTISQLIENLEELRDMHGDDCEVRLMTQQSWPFENTIHGVTSSDEIRESQNDEDDDDNDSDDDPSEVVIFLVEGQQLGYGSKAAWDCCAR